MTRIVLWFLCGAVFIAGMRSISSWKFDLISYLMGVATLAFVSATKWKAKLTNGREGSKREKQSNPTPLADGRSPQN